MKPRLLLFLLLAVAGCSDQDSPGQAAPGAAMDAVARPSDPVIPCFPDEGPVVMKIDGVPVPKGALTRFIAMFKKRVPSYSEATAGREVIEKVLIPQASLYALHRDDLPRVTARAESAWKRIQEGTEFAVVAREMSDDYGTRSRGGQLKDKLARSTQETTIMSPSMEEVVFSTAPGIVSRPFISVLGVQIVKVLKEHPGQTERFNQREVAHILFVFDPAVESTFQAADADRPETLEPAGKAFAELQKRLQKAKDSAKVEVIDPAYADWIYQFRKK